MNRKNAIVVSSVAFVICMLMLPSTNFSAVLMLVASLLSLITCIISIGVSKPIVSIMWFANFVLWGTFSLNLFVIWSMLLFFKG